MAAKKKILFIMNPISGNAKKTGIPKIIETTLDTGLFDFEIEQTKYVGHACELAVKAKDNGYDAVVAVGGDGTVNDVAKALTHSETALGIIPCGSGNGLARHLMLPMDIAKAVEVINAFTIHDLDYGVINDIPFFCTCGMGFDAFISMKFAESGRRGPVTYLENILREGVKYKPETYEIKDESGSSLCRAFLISCANASQYGNNAYIAPQASMSDGLLDVIVIKGDRSIETIRTIFHFIKRNTGSYPPGVVYFKSDDITVNSYNDESTDIDGQQGPSFPIHITCEKGALRIIVPAASGKKKRTEITQ